MDTQTNRYAHDWNGYSAEWERRFGARYRHLGEEWCDDGTAERQWEERLFAHSVAPWLTPATSALEIGCGGGKWTVRLAPRVRDLRVFDVAEAMLERTRRRVESDGLVNVTFHLGNGRDPLPCPAASLDLVFSYDVFVHIALEDTVAYVNEIARVLKPGGTAILHHAIGDVAPAWDRIESHNDWYRDRANTLGQYYYYSREMLDRMYDRAGLRVDSTWNDYCTSVVVVRKPADSAVPRLEQALRHAAIAAGPAALDDAARAITDLGHDMARTLESLAAALRQTPEGAERYRLVQQIRRFVRG